MRCQMQVQSAFSGRPDEAVLAIKAVRRHAQSSWLGNQSAQCARHVHAPSATPLCPLLCTWAVRASTSALSVRKAAVPRDTSWK